VIALARLFGRTVCVAGTIAAAPLAGQAAPWTADRAGSDDERYLRTLQVAWAEVYPWSVRAFSGAEFGRMLPADGDAHPWDTRRVGHRPNRLNFEILPPRSTTHLNTGFAYDADHAGPWAGRGVTSLAAAGVRAHLGPLSIRLEPEVAWAQNADFDLRSNGSRWRRTIRRSAIPAYHRPAPAFRGKRVRQGLAG
jgi:hypothetical protein